MQKCNLPADLFLFEARVVTLYMLEKHFSPNLYDIRLQLEKQFWHSDKVIGGKEFRICLRIKLACGKGERCKGAVAGLLPWRHLHFAA